MAVPSKNFTNIPDGDIDADSPLTETLMTQIRDSLIHLEEWLGVDYSAAQNHDHDGVNSKNIPGGAISTAVQSEANQPLASGATWTPSAGVYNMMRALSGAGNLYVELYISSAWQRHKSEMSAIGIMIFDGTNMRIRNVTGASSDSIWWQKF